MNLETILLTDRYYCLEARDDFWVYRQYINPSMKISWFQKEIAYELMQFYQDYKNGKRPKLIIEAPPQHGKSVQVIEFISWLAGHDPDSKAIYTSFSERLGIRANLRLQRIYDSEKYNKVFPETKINSSNVIAISGQYLRNREILEYVDKEGYFRNTTIRGAITGESLDIGIIDDPIKGREEASSTTIRDKTWNWLTDDFLTRFSDFGALLIIGTRWHIDDPIGRLRESYKEIKILSYKAIAESDEKNRSAGEALFPNHKSIEFLLERKKIMNPLSWLSLYQSSPTLGNGNLFQRDNFKYFTFNENIVHTDKDYLIDNFHIFQTIDVAGTENKNSDYFVCITFGLNIHNGDLIILDIYREKKETTKHMNVMESQFQKWQAIQYVENKQFGINIIQSYKQTSRPVEKLEAKGSKELRSLIVQSFYNNGKIWHRQGASWLDDFEEEILSFPLGLHDDQVDCLSYGGIVAQSIPLGIQDFGTFHELY
jgi:predicted phage terminase large subunit-like protein